MHDALTPCSLIRLDFVGFDALLLLLYTLDRWDVGVYVKAPMFTSSVVRKPWRVQAGRERGRGEGGQGKLVTFYFWCICHTCFAGVVRTAAVVLHT